MVGKVTQLDFLSIISGWGQQPQSSFFWLQSETYIHPLLTLNIIFSAVTLRPQFLRAMGFNQTLPIPLSFRMWLGPNTDIQSACSRLYFLQGYFDRYYGLWQVIQAVVPNHLAEGFLLAQRSQINSITLHMVTVFRYYGRLRLKFRARYS